MKHTSAFKSLLLLLSLAVLFSSCGEKANGPDTYPADFILGEDSQYMYQVQSQNTTMAATKDGYYFLIHNYIYYADKDTMKLTVLCNKPDCLHEKETDPQKVLNCNAFVNPGLSSRGFLSLYKDRLYVLSGYDNAQQKEQPQLVSISLDGTNRKTEFLLPPEMTFMTLHRGYFYYVLKNFENPEESYSQIMQHELGKSQTQEECIFTSKMQGGDIQDLICRGNQLYFNEHGEHGEKYISHILMYDITSKVTKRILTEDDNQITNFLQFVDNRIYTSLFDLQNDTIYTDTKFYSTDLQGNDMHEKFSAPNMFSTCLDQKYMYGGYPGSSPEDKPEIARMDIYDHTGTLKDSVEIPNAHWMLSFAPGDDQYIFLQYDDDTYTYVDLIDKKEIGSKNIKPISFFKMETSYINKGVLAKAS
ncbi:MAG: hypothetical protein ACLSAP_00930 [Oscillospiraceae bacterium]